MDQKLQISGKYEKDINKAIQILKESGCEEIFLFGSVASQDVKAKSDIDLAIRGCPRGLFFHLLGRLIMELDHRVDLVKLDSEDAFSQYLEKEGELVQIA